MKIKTKITGTKSVLNALNIREHRAMAKTSTNKSGNKAYIQARRAIKKRYNLKAKIGEMPLKKIKATAANLTYGVEVPTRMYNIGALFKGTKQTKAGAKVQILKGRKTLIQGAFVARPKGNNYKRLGQKKVVKSNNDLVLTRDQGRGAYPLYGVGDRVPKGIGWATMLLNAKVKGTMSVAFQEEYQKAFNVALRKLVDRKGSK